MQESVTKECEFLKRQFNLKVRMEIKNDDLTVNKDGILLDPQPEILLNTDVSYSVLLWKKPFSRKCQF